ncbi:hypothetical protein ABK040_007790 [Willaertia magna]
MTSLPSTKDIQEAIPVANKFLDFVNRSKTPWHAVQSVKTILLENGFEQLQENEANWSQKIKQNGKYFFTRNHSSVFAFTVGGKFEGNGNGALKIIGAHTDSPDLRLKPISAQDSVGYLQVGVQTYGGGLFYTWFDRDLTVAGRVIVKRDDGFKQELVEVKKPILRIPSLAIHLNREVREKGFQFNYETQLLPVIATQLSDDENLGDKKGFLANHHSILIRSIAKELNCKPEDIKDFELSVVDTQPSVIGGANDEFVFSPRLDNLLSCFCSLEALLASQSTLNDDTDIRMICLFDHEEVGSESSHGAGGSLLKDTIERLIKVTQTENSPVDAYNACIAKSFIVSADMAHAVHPNYVDKHQCKHRPQIHKGLVIKTNANLRYTSNSHTSFLFGELAGRHNLPLQQFVVRNDSACGSTIGPITNANTSIRCIDVGIPQLSMHSIREQCGVIDIKTTVELFTVFFNEFREVDNLLRVD